MIYLPWPPSSLSGHNTGHHFTKASVIKKHRQWAHDATRAAKKIAPPEGDILLTVTFIPPDNRTDRTNMPNRMKPYIDGIADALGIDDRRFIPRYFFAPPEKPGQVHIEIGGYGLAAIPYSERRLVK